MLEFLNDTALITGASRGIGKAIAIELGKLGVNIIGTATTEDGVTTIQQYLNENNINGNGIIFNALDESTYENIFNASTDISILINNAGIVKDNIIFKMSDDEWNNVIDVNLTSVFKLIKRISKKMMAKRYGRIINISSISAYKPEIGHFTYMASKSGLTGLTHGVALDLARFNITVNCVAPGLIDTDMTKDLKLKDERIKKIPVGRIGEPSDISNAVTFLASRNSGFITGSTIHVNGGVYMN